ncbi:MAG: hypothetical protein C0187_04840 [Calditerrivibrio nitroreducens]|uniref:DUF3311 domain-containing protein n=1 Tax=Calditerrivibrio nitroreducens TaxID=477976 RepID=A0A2J6WKG8_9BACT|nr:MAG: hypothetical protein C0187_04840 [Calditerrivibrio nitroreducens]
MRSKGLWVWMTFFCCGLLFINYPFIKIFDKKIFIFKIPLIYFYFFIGWVGSIIVVYIFRRIFLRNED